MISRVRSGETAQDRRLLWIEILDLHAKGLLRMPWIQALIVSGIGLFIVPAVSLSSFVAWAVMPVGAEVLRAMYARALLRRSFSIHPSQAHLIFVVLAALSGASISVGAILFFPRLPPVDQALLAATLFALPAAGVAVSSSRYILSAYAICVLVPAAYTWGVLHPEHAWGLAALSSAYCVTIFAVSSDGENLVLRSVIIRHQRDQLILDLESRNVEVLDAVNRAERAAQAKARVLAAASHDLRQPLHALSLYSAVLAADPTSETVRELSQNIDQIVRSLGSLLNGLLDLSRLSAAHYVPEEEVLDVKSILMQVCDEYHQVALHKHLQFSRELQHVWVRSDSLAIARIVRNLVDNAIKYTDAGTIMVTNELEYRADGPLLLIRVSDTGSGIPASEHERIFEEFYQVDNPGRDHGKGVGLGLAIVKRLCELMHGSVAITSAPGQGTSFEISLPARLVTERPGKTSASPFLAPQFSGKRIYIVDDEVEILRSMQKLLVSWKAEVSVATSALGCEQLMESHRPDLLILDLRLGEKETGAQLAQRLHLRYGSFPIMIVTGETSSEALTQAQALGCPLLQKPIAAELLANAIAAAFVNEVALEALGSENSSDS